jgi:hypothetical protein
MGLFNDAFRYFGRLGRFDRQNTNYYTLQSIGDTVPTWINTTNKWDLYGRIPELQSVINRRAKMVASANPYICDADGNVILYKDLPADMKWLEHLIDRPTPMLSWGRMIEMVEVNKCVTGNALIYSPKRTFGTRQIAVPIAFNNVKIHANRKGYKQLEKSGVIEKFEIAVDNKGTFETFLPNEVVYIFENDGINLMDTRSKLEALQYPLSNIEKSYEKRNVILKNMFALGILSAEMKDGITNRALTAKDIEQERDDIKSRHKNEVIITKNSFKWQPMSYPTKDLMLFEENQADFVRIIDAYGLNENMFGNVLGKGSTFANTEGGERQAYNSTIIPETEIIYDEITTQWGLDKLGYYLKPDFSHISVLQEDAEKLERAKKQEVERLSLLHKEGIISAESFAEMAGVEFETIDRSEAQQQSLLNAQLNLRGTVGGLNGIIDLNRAVADGNMTRETAVNTLVSYYGYDRSVANSMITGA